ncbi:chalcone isomerase family protein [Undibacterium sp. Jales W-56]|uniref:chalcone isomerase family protein n=1 Tax=Undibacterium sp. Jales W-56 TaxID=2897325 RepID=UPI0021D02691|nr:chalcone isomerase family protein [Undibacterium sp. Jales W-56]MCU6435023.1 chalcone isomerase family protein [Undibacterium sp. Jales W-56]
MILLNRACWTGCVSAMLLYAALAFAGSQQTPAGSHIQQELNQAKPLGHGTFRWFGIAVYDAQLWVGKDGYAPEANGQLGRQPIALDLTYARSLIGKKIAEASIEEIQKLKLGSEEQRKTWLAQMTQLFPNVKEGNHITGVFLPGLAARFYFDGKLLGEIRDPEFAHAFFSIWLDKKTSAPGLRDKLLEASNK